MKLVTTRTSEYVPRRTSYPYDKNPAPERNVEITNLPMYSFFRNVIILQGRKPGHRRAKGAGTF